MMEQNIFLFLRIWLRLEKGILHEAIFGATCNATCGTNHVM
jgi:hypothetical protein